MAWSFRDCIRVGNIILGIPFKHVDRLFEVGLAKTFSLNVRVSFAIEYKCNVDIDS